MSSDSENDRVSYLARYPIDQEEVSRTGRRIIWANECCDQKWLMDIIWMKEKAESRMVEEQALWRTVLNLLVRSQGPNHTQ
uniref:Uncharacterized protein n=1 Tax=Ditylenchus dipsaci TaxID=166011 RepID=A0A915CPY5_9BILA